MRKFALLAVVFLLALPAASPARRGLPGDGTLSVRDGWGRVIVVANGAIIGRFADGTLTVNDPSDDDGTEPIVRGAENRRSVSETRTVYRGKKVRFRLIGGRFTLRLTGTGMFLTVVGRGHVKLRGDWGTYSLNGQQYQPLPFELTTLRLRAPAGG